MQDLQTLAAVLRGGVARYGWKERLTHREWNREKSGHVKVVHQNVFVRSERNLKIIALILLLCARLWKIIAKVIHSYTMTQC